MSKTRPERPTPRAPRRSLRRLAAGVGTLGVATGTSGLVGPAPATSAPAPAAAPAADVSHVTATAARTTGWASQRWASQGWAAAPASTASACDADAITVDTSPVQKSNGQIIGEAQLQYSPTCRKVRAIGFTYNWWPACNRTGGAYDHCITSFVTHDHTDQPGGPACPEAGAHVHASAYSAHGTRKSVTAWEDDRLIVQQACIHVRHGGNMVARGTTIRY